LSLLDVVFLSPLLMTPNVSAPTCLPTVLIPHWCTSFRFFSTCWCFLLFWAATLPQPDALYGTHYSHLLPCRFRAIVTQRAIHSFSRSRGHPLAPTTSIIACHNLANLTPLVCFLHVRSSVSLAATRFRVAVSSTGTGMPYAVAFLILRPS